MSIIPELQLIKDKQAAESLSHAEVMQLQIEVSLERWAKDSGYVKLQPGCHCPTCTCNH